MKICGYYNCEHCLSCCSVVPRPGTCYWLSLVFITACNGFRPQFHDVSCCCSFSGVFLWLPPHSLTILTPRLENPARLQDTTDSVDCLNKRMRYQLPFNVCPSKVKSTEQLQQVLFWIACVLNFDNIGWDPFQFFAKKSHCVGALAKIGEGCTFQISLLLFWDMSRVQRWHFSGLMQGCFFRILFGFVVCWETSIILRQLRSSPKLSKRHEVP